MATAKKTTAKKAATKKAAVKKTAAKKAPAKKTERKQWGGLGPLLDPSVLANEADWAMTQLKFRLDPDLEESLEAWAPHRFSSRGAAIAKAISVSLEQVPGLRGLIDEDRKPATRECAWLTVSLTVATVRRLQPLFKQWAAMPHFEENGSEFLRRLAARGLAIMNKG